MTAWMTAHVQACVRALRRLAAQPVGSVLSVLVIGLAIALPLGLYLLFINVSAAASRVNTDPNFNIYLSLDAGEGDVRELERRIKALPNLGSLRFISKDTALADMRRIPSLKDLMASIEGNPLPHAFSIRPNSADAEVLATIRGELSRLPKVDRVVMDFEWAEKLRRFATFAERLVMLIGLVLGLAVVFVTGNTIRLQILTQREEIEVSQLIGATRRFVRRPFLYFGAAQGLLSGTVAVILISALVSWVGTELLALTASYGSEFALKAPGPELILLVLCVSAFLGWVGALLSVAMYLYRAR